MSRQRRGLQLPHALQQELGIEQASNNRRNNGIRNRKEQRKTQRVEKRQHHRGSKGPPAGRRNDRVVHDQVPEDDLDEDGEFDDSEPEETITHIRQPQPEPRPGSMLKKSISLPSAEESDDSEEEGSESEELERLYRGDTPEIVLDANSRSYKDKEAEDDDEIAALEKRLGLKGRKKGVDNDGLADLLGAEDEEQPDRRKRKREVDDWLKSKRRKAEAAMQHAKQAVNEESGSDLESDYDDDSDGSGAESDDLDPGLDGLAENDDFSGFESDDNTVSKDKPPPKVRENPYLPPVSAPYTAKYIPPSLRKPQGTDDEALTRLRRQLQGHLNKLSEANLISILSAIESVYGNNPRGSVTNLLVDLLLSLFSSPTSLSNTFSILHGAFAAAVYRVIGIDFGASLLSSLVDRLFTYHTTSTTTKEPLNLISLVCNLFIFNVVASPLIYSVIRYLLTPLTEYNTELLLRLIRDCGPQLRLDDPTALKTIVSLTQQAASEMEARDGQLSVRTKFMLETIIDLKNNKLRNSTADVGATKEHLTRMRKALGSLSNRNLRATEPLRVDLNDIRNSDRKGKWWLIGASWKGHDLQDTQPNTNSPSHNEPAGSEALHSTIDSSEPDYALLARQTLHLSTPLAISIFTAIASSPTAIHAHERLLKLNLRNAQIPEIPRVLVRCCAAEPDFNEFYGVLAKRLCVLGDKAKRIAKGFEFACWGWLRRIGAAADGNEDGDDEDDGFGEGSGVEMSEVNNVSRLYASLIVSGSLNLGILKVIDLHVLKADSAGQLWVELLLVRVLVLCEGDEVLVKRLFERLGSSRQVVPRLRVFGRQWVRGSKLVEGKERKVVKRGWKVAEAVLEDLGLGLGVGEGV